MSIKITYIVAPKVTVCVEIEVLCMNPDCGWRMHEILTTPEIKNKFSVAARRHVRERGHPVHVTKSVVDMYHEKECVKMGKPPRGINANPTVHTTE